MCNCVGWRAGILSWSENVQLALRVCLKGQPVHKQHFTSIVLGILPVQRFLKAVTGDTFSFIADRA